VQLTKKRELANGGATSASPADLDDLSTDPVALAAREYGKFESKIASIAQLRFLPGIRPELAMMSLGRAYVNRCVQNNGPWTSGIHLIWWTRRRLREVPDVKVEDLRVETPVPLSRQVELARWSIMMMRLILISDVASYASKHERVARLASFAEQAAASTGELSPGRLEKWIRRTGEDLFDAALPQRKYEEIAADLHKEPDDSSP
jgi:hypothetical protein